MVEKVITSFKNQGIANIPETKLAKIQGKLTSQIRQRSEKEPYYYAFIKLKGQGADLPVIFRIKNTPIYEGFIKKNTGKYVSYSQCYNTARGNKCRYEDTQHCGECLNKLKQEFKDLESWIKPKLEKGDLIELSGHYSNSDKNIRKSFTCLYYNALDQKVKKRMFGMRW